MIQHNAALMLCQLFLSHLKREFQTLLDGQSWNLVCQLATHSEI